MRKRKKNQAKSMLLNFDLEKNTYRVKSNNDIEIRTSESAVIYCRVSDIKQVREGHGLE